MFQRLGTVVADAFTDFDTERLETITLD
jgi:hypothetical protein